MHFRQIDIRGFGTLSNLPLEDLEPGMNVFYGRNGSGKTTILQFLRGVLTGYQEAYRLRLLPPLSGGQPGGGVIVETPSGRYELIRHARLGHPDTVAINSRSGDAQSVADLRKQIQNLSADVVCSVFAVGGYESLKLESLVATALDSGIELRSSRQSASWVEARLENIARERSDLFSGNPTRGQIPALESQQEELKRKMQAAREAQSQQVSHRQRMLQQLREDIARRQAEVDWLCQELQAVEADISEVNDRLWSTRREVVRVTETVATPPLEQPPGWTVAIQTIDREIEHAQQVLRDLAASRHRISVARADLAGAEALDAGQELQQQRQAIEQIEQQASHLQNFLSRRPESPQNECFCQPLATEVGVTVQTIREQLWRLCQELSRQQTAHEQALLGSQRERVDRCERDLIHQIRCLRLEREAILRRSNGTPAQQAAFRTAHEARHCGCHTHESLLPAIDSIVEVVASEPKTIVREEVVTVSRARPGDRERQQRLSERRVQLRRQMLEGIARLRAARAEYDRLLASETAFGDDRTLQSLRYEYAVIEQQLADRREQWESLALLQSILQATHQKLTQEVASPVMQEASAWLARMTVGRYPRFRFDRESGELRVMNAAGTELSASSLSRGTLEQAVLCFRLALCNEYCRRGVDLPLILDDVLADSDQDRLRAALTVLIEFSRDHQVLFLTCQEHLAELFESLQVRVRTLPGSIRQRTGVAPVIPEPVTVRNRVPEEIIPHSANRLRAVETEPVDRVQPDEPYWLQVDSPVHLVPSLGEQMSRRLGSLGVRTVLDLVELDPEITEIPLDSLQISAATLRLWQAEARLLCCVPDLTGRDAQLLVLCGILSPAELAECDLEELWGRMQRLREQQVGDLSLPWLTERRDWPQKEALARWIQRGRASRSLRKARDWAVRRQLAHRDPAPVRGRVGESISHAASVRLHVRESIDPSPSDLEREWRYFLRIDSPVVDAPSIGPRTAERLEAVGILTVSDLLACDVDRIAARIDRREITPAVLETWKQQAFLMCRVPELRGHDVQVLVACGITEPEMLSQFTPEKLYAEVGPFANSREGQRLLRSSRTPDLEEVTDWIACARQAVLQTRAA